MNRKHWFIKLVLFVALVAVLQQLFIAAVPQLVFTIAKHRSAKPYNTFIHTTKTDAGLRRVVLPNPDFIYSACFYDLGDKIYKLHVLVPDSSQYCSIGFYDCNMQPYRVLNNYGYAKRSELMVAVSQSPLLKTNYLKVLAPHSKGVILIRYLATDSAQRQAALQLQQAIRFTP